MSNIDIIRAWKDDDYLNSLSEEQRSQLPENPAGIVELSDEDMEGVNGGWGSYYRCGGGGSNGCNNSQNGICVTNGNGAGCNSIGICPGR
jgi:mersacidin/lichenicidin family type 2 lantibiotic